MNAYRSQHRVRRALYPMDAQCAAISARGLAWPEFRDRVESCLNEQGYSAGTMRIYRHVLRSFGKWFYSTPERVTARAVKAYVWKLTEHERSWSWTSINISALRVMFDRLCGYETCKDLVTPKRPNSLPSYLNRDEIWRLLSSADTARDQLILGLLYGCGLKVGDLCALRWSDVDCAAREIRIGADDEARRVAYSSQLAPLLEKGRAICRADEYIFQGARAGTHLSVRMVEYVLRRAATLAAIEKPVCGMTLRHSYAVHRLHDGASIRDVQEALGLKSLDSAMVYQRCILPTDAHSPLEGLAELTASLAIPCPSEENSPVNPGPETNLPASAAPEVPAPDLPAALPFEPVDISLTNHARLFYRSMKLHIRNRFLALRAAIDGS